MTCFYFMTMMVTVVALLVSCLLVHDTTSPAFFFIDAQKLKQAGTASVPAANSFQTAVIDTEASIVLFGTASGQVCMMKYDNTAAATNRSATADESPHLSFPQANSCSHPPSSMMMMQSASPTVFRVAAIYPQNRTAFFGTNNGHVCMVKYNNNNDELEFSFLSCLNLTATNGNEFPLSAAVVDGDRNFAYFSSIASPAIFRLRIAARSFSFDSTYVPSQVLGGYSTAVIDTDHSVAFFCNMLHGIGGYNICMLDLTTFRFAGSCVNFGYASPSFNSATIDSSSSRSFWISRSSICVVNISRTNLSNIACIPAPTRITNLGTSMSTIAVDTKSSTAYIGLETEYHVCVFNTSGLAFGSCSQLPSGPSGTNSPLTASVIDTRNAIVIFGSADDPALACAINISSNLSSSSSSCLVGPSAPVSFTAAVIDDKGERGDDDKEASAASSVAYFAGFNPFGHAMVCKFDVVFPDGFSYNSCITAPGSSYSHSTVFNSAVLHKPTNSSSTSSSSSSAHVAVFGFLGNVASLADTGVLVVNVSASNFSFVSIVSAPPGTILYSNTVIDDRNALAYFGSVSYDSNLAEVCAFSLLNFTFVSCATLPQYQLLTAVIDAPSTISDDDDDRPAVLYFGGSVDGSNDGCICIFDTMPLKLKKCISPQARSNPFTSSVVDTAKGVTLWGTQYSTVCLLKISPSSTNDGDDNNVTCFSSPSSVCSNIKFDSAFIDTSSSIAYFGSSSGNKGVCAVHYSTTDDGVFSPASFSHPISGFASAVIDTQHSVAYFGTTTSAKIFKVYLNNFDCDEAGTLTVSQNLNSTATFSSLSRCNVVMSDISAVSLVFVGDVADSSITFNNITFTAASSSLSSSSSSSSSVPIRISQTASSTSFNFSSIRALHSSFMIRLDSSNPFSESTTTTTNFTLQNNDFSGQNLLLAPDDVDLKDSSWMFKCNKFHHGYNHLFEVTAIQHDVGHLIFDCPRTASASPSRSKSLSYSQTSPCITFTEESACMAHTSSQHCRFCPGINLCVTLEENECPSCSVLDETRCHLTNGRCRYCATQQVCVNATTSPACECEFFSVADCAVASSSSSCKWCANLNSCTITDNKKCECYYLTSADKCSPLTTNNTCSWCSSSDPIESYKLGETSLASKTFKVTNTFSYCVNKHTDECECSHLPTDFCQYVSSSTHSHNSTNYSTTCKYCSKLDLCTRQENTECDCGQEYSPRGCQLSPVCSFEPAVLTVTEGFPYCTKNTSALQTCPPIACQGITDKFACDASKCTYDPSTKTCQTGDCFNFFVPGFTMQPYVLYFLGLFKDIIVVLLIGAIGDFFTRPIMNVVFTVLKRIKGWHHIENRIKDQVLYMSDPKCRDSKKFSFSFAEYVEQICEDVFEFVDEESKQQLLDEERRLALFDITAFCLFDNMLWIEPVFDDEEQNDNENDSINNNNNNNQIIPEEREVLPADKKSAAAPSINDDEEIESDKLEQKLVANKESPRTKQHFTMKVKGNSSSTPTYSPPNQEDTEEENHLVSAADTPRNDDGSKNNNNNNNNNNASARIRPVEHVVKLTADDFQSLATLRTKVEATLLDRASSFIYYSQSRNKVTAACAAINSFPSSLQLVGYISLVSALYITSFITVSNFPSISQVVTGCNKFNTQTGGSVNFSGSFILLGFRLMNASAEATSVLILVKTIRGFYQKFTGLCNLSLQQRIPLMGLFADRPIQITLTIYALIILPFALAGPLYGGIKVSWRCWVPVFVGAAVIVVNWIVLFVVRWYSRSQLLALDRAKKTTHIEQVQQKSKREEADAAGQIKTNDNDDEYDLVVVDDDARSEISLSTVVNSFTKRSSLSASKRRQSSAIEHQEHIDETGTDEIVDGDTIVSAAPAKLGKAILVFLMTEELPVVAISLALQVSFNYFCLLYFKDAFGIFDESDVYWKDYHDRKLHCVWLEIQNDASAMTSLLSSFVPF